MSFKYENISQDGPARRGRFTTAHGEVDTPAFMPVGTAATVKAMRPEQVAETGAQILLGNTYHLMLRPGAERVHELGGLHTFMNWDKPILTDSGGYQVMSLAQLRKITEEGVAFNLILMGVDISLHRSVPSRFSICSTLISPCPLMNVPRIPADEKTAADSMRLSMRWAERSRAAFREREGYGLFGIVQGSIYPDLREESCSALKAIGFDGICCWGVSRRRRPGPDVQHTRCHRAAFAGQSSPLLNGGREATRHGRCRSTRH